MAPARMGLGRSGKAKPCPTLPYSNLASQDLNLGLTCSPLETYFERAASQVRVLRTIPGCCAPTKGIYSLLFGLGSVHRTQPKEKRINSPFGYFTSKVGRARQGTFFRSGSQPALFYIQLHIAYPRQLCQRAHLNMFRPLLKYIQAKA